MNKPDNITDNDWRLLNKKYKNITRIVHKIEKGYPVQYLIGDVSFYGYNIVVNKNVLIPRFETETLVEKTIKYLREKTLEDVDVLDIGTGSGCISIALKKELPSLKITAIDISSKVIKIAKKNAKKNNVKINFIHKNIYKYKPVNKYGLIISNPPYLKYNERVDRQVLFEPKKALYAKNNGLEYYEYIIKKASRYLCSKGIIAFEIGYDQGEYLKKYAKSYFPDAIITVEKDLSNKDRYLFIIND